MIQRNGRPASEVCHRFDPVPQVMKNFRYKGGQPLDNDQVKRAISDAEVKLNGGRLVIRPSGTEPVIRVMGEGDNVELVEAVVDDIVEYLAAPPDALDSALPGAIGRVTSLTEILTRLRAQFAGTAKPAGRGKPRTRAVLWHAAVEA